LVFVVIFGFVSTSQMIGWKWSGSVVCAVRCWTILYHYQCTDDIN